MRITIANIPSKSPLRKKSRIAKDLSDYKKIGKKVSKPKGR